MNFWDGFFWPKMDPTPQSPSTDKCTLASFSLNISTSNPQSRLMGPMLILHCGNPCATFLGTERQEVSALYAKPGHTAKRRHTPHTTPGPCNFIPALVVAAHLSGQQPRPTQGTTLDVYFSFKNKQLTHEKHRIPMLPFHAALEIPGCNHITSIS